MQNDNPNAVKSSAVNFTLSVRMILIIIGIIGSIWLLLHVLPVMAVLVIALMIVGALSPIVTSLEKRKTGRVFALCLVFGIGVVVTASLALLTIPTVVTQLKNLSDNEAGFRETVASRLEQSRFTSYLADELRNIRYAELVKSFKTSLVSMGTGLFMIIASSVAAVFLAFYMMLDRDRLRGALFALVPREHHIRLSRVMLNLGTIVGSYIRGQVLTCVFSGVFLLVVLLGCGVPNALAIAVFGGIMDLFPYIGFLLTLIPAMLAASVKGPTIVAIVFVLILDYEEIESRVLVPLVYGRVLRLPSSVIFFSLILGTALAGIVGALVALPLAAAVLMVIEELRVKLPGETVQPEDIEQLREDARIEQEYERRAETMPVEKAAAIAVEISGERKNLEDAAEQPSSVAKEMHAQQA